MSGLLLLAVLARAAMQQTPQSPASDTAAQITRAAATITGADIAAFRTALLADSMRGQAPSAAVDRAAQYVAAQLRTFGLSVPAVSEEDQKNPEFVFARNRYADGVHRYPVPGQLRVDYEQSVFKFFVMPHGATAALTESGNQPASRTMRIPLTTMARVLDTAVVPHLVSSFFDFLASDAGVLIAGRHSLASAREVDVRRRTVIYIPPAGQDSAEQDAIVRDLAARSGGVVVVPSTDSATLARRREAAQPPALMPFALPSSGAWSVEVEPRAMDDILRLNDIDLAALRTASAPVVRSLPYLMATVEWAARPMADTVTAPNVVAVLPGSDSSLQTTERNYVVIVASLDAGRAGDSSGVATDNATSLAGLLALAKAFTQPGARPRRPLVFLAASSGAAQWGSRRFLFAGWGISLPSLALPLDLRWPLADTLAWAGQDIRVEPSPAWIGALHPEVGVTVVDTGSIFSLDGEPSAFAARWVPTLAFRAGGHGAPMDRGTRGVGPAEAGDTAAAARVLQLLFYSIRTIAGGRQLPEWTAEARKRLPPPLP